MSYALSTTTTRSGLAVPAPAPSDPTPPAAPAKPRTRAVSVRAEVLIPESAERFADLVVSTHAFRKELDTLLAPGKPHRTSRIIGLSAYGVPGLIGIGCLFAGVGEGVAAALALFGVVRCVLPPRSWENPVTAKAADAVQEAYVKAAAGREPTGVAALRHAAVTALEKARDARGLSPQAELMLQTLAFTPVPDADADTQGRRVATTAEALQWRQYEPNQAYHELKDVEPFEVIALEARAAVFGDTSGYANRKLDIAASAAQKVLDKAASENLKTVIAHGGGEDT